MDERAERTFRLAESVAQFVESRGGRAALIGAVALAIHGYTRGTTDVDLATNEHDVRGLFEALKQEFGGRYEVSYALGDDDDPLGGVLTIMGDDIDEVQVVNFLNPRRLRNTPGKLAIETAVVGALGELPIVRLPNLIALKLYAGGFQSKGDVQALLERNIDIVDLAEVADLAAKFGLERDLEEILDAIGLPHS